MLLADNMIDLTSKSRVVFVNQAVFAEAFRLTNANFRKIREIATHEQ